MFSVEKPINFVQEADGRESNMHNANCRVLIPATVSSFHIDDKINLEHLAGSAKANTIVVFFKCLLCYRRKDYLETYLKCVWPEASRSSAF